MNVRAKHYILRKFEVDYNNKIGGLKLYLKIKG